MWYACHAFLYFKYKDGEQTDYTGWENIYLIEAESFDDALVKGKIRAQEDEDEGDDGTFRVNDRPVRITLAAILKVVECVDLCLETEKPVHGTELSYSDVTALDRAEFEKLIAGRDAVVTYHGVREEETPVAEEHEPDAKQPPTEDAQGAAEALIDKLRADKRR